jgi:HSP20 family protein
MTYVKYYPVPKARTANPYGRKSWTPAYDVVEHEDKFVLEFDLPGFAKSDFTINVKEGVLTVSGERKAVKIEENDFFRYYGRPYGTFERTFRLNDKVNEEKLKASYKNGVLKIDLPKREELKPRTIEIA